MLSDVVIDANILGHSLNPGSGYFDDSVEFLKVLLAASTLICVDRDFAIGAGNTSLIGQEYLNNVGFGSTATTTLQQLMSSGRVKSVPVNVPSSVRSRIRSLIPRNAHDRRYAQIAYNSDERYLVSHDFDDFPAAVRTDLDRYLGITVAIAAEGCLALAKDDEEDSESQVDEDETAT